MFRPLLALAFAAANLVAVTAPALAATPVSTAGLDIASPAGAALLDARLVQAAARECAPDNPMDLRLAAASRACQADVLREARAHAQHIVAEARQRTDGARTAGR
jgi:UrcA family protein